MILFPTVIIKAAGATKYMPMFSKITPIPYPSISDSELMSVL